MLSDKLATITALITISGFLYAGYSQLATKSDLQRSITINNFKWSESNIKINDLQLDSLDRIKLERELTTSENRHYESIVSSTKRIVKAQEAILNAENIID